MSARSGSQGGLRRSVSLTRISRPSIGVSQHGAQRVSGAAFDSRSSDGYSTILLFYVHCMCWMVLLSGDIFLRSDTQYSRQLRQWGGGKVHAACYTDWSAHVIEDRHEWDWMQQSDGDNGQATGCR